MVEGNMKYFLNQLRKQEGGKIHRNKTESDITTSCGIYRYHHKDAEVFKYIDSVAEAVGVHKPSQDWTQEDLDKVNGFIDSEIEDQFTAEFYKAYFKSLDLERLYYRLVLPYASIYITSNKLANRALQHSCNALLKKYPGIFQLDVQKELKVDGVLGETSQDLIYALSKKMEEEQTLSRFGGIWESIFLSYCKTYYVKMATTNFKKGNTKDLLYLEGWINRCDRLFENYIGVAK